MKRFVPALNVTVYVALLTASLAQSPRAVQAASSSRVHIAPTTAPAGATSIEIGSDHWSARGYDLRALIAEIYAVDSRRIELPATETARYDLSLALPEDATEEQTQRLLQQALQQKFKITITPQTRAMDVYVLTAPQGPGPALHVHLAPAAEDTPQFTYQGRNCPGISSAGISASAGTIAEFRRTLEPNLDRPLVDETNLAGAYDFQIGQYRSTAELFQILRTQLGILVTPSRRSVEILAVQPQTANVEVGSL